MTIWNAMANFEENEKGSLEIGKKANITMLNADLMSVKAKDFLWLPLWPPLLMVK